MAQIAHRCRDLPQRQTGQFPSDDADGAAVALLAEEYAAQLGLAAGHGTRYADDVPGVGRQRQPPEDRRTAVIGEGDVLQRHILRPGALQSGQRFRRLHQRLDALSGHLRPLHGVKQLGGLGGFGGHPHKTEQKRGERRNVPALPSRAQHVFSAEPQDKQHTDVGYRQIQRRQGRLLFYPFLLCLSSLLFILFGKK